MPRRRNRSESSPSESKTLSLNVSFSGWRVASQAFKSWAKKMSLLHKPTWEKAGIFEALLASTKRIHKDTNLLLGIADKWCPDTNTFVFPWGEATITLEDVTVLLGFSVLGFPYFATLDSSGEKILGKLEKERVSLIKKSKLSFVTQPVWMERFMDSGDELEHVAFLVLWLCYFVFPSRYHHIHRDIMPIAVHLSRGTRIALAPAVLAHLYADLTLLKDYIRDFNMTPFTDKLELRSLFKLVQVWTWERFRELRPRNNNPLLIGEPRLFLWHDSKRRKAKSNVSKVLENSKMDSFEWRPYTKAVRNWKLPQFYPEKAVIVPVDQNRDDEFVSFARCIKKCELVGIDRVEHYFPNRVASQFGLLQDVPCPVNRNNLSIEAAWDEYNKPIDELTLYIPSRSTTPRFTPMFCEWWKKSSPEFQRSLKKNRDVELDESLAPRNIISDDNSSDSVPSDSKRRKLMKQVCEDDESNMGRYQTQVPSENDEEDDSLSIAQVMRLRKKNTALCPSGENYSSDPPKVLPLSEVLQTLEEGYPKELKRSRTTTNVRFGIVNCGGSASREVPVNELFQESLLKRKSEHLGEKRAREDCYDNTPAAEMIRSREKNVGDASESFGKTSNSLEADDNYSLICQKLASKDETVAPLEIELRSEGNEEEEEETKGEANENNSSDPPLFGADVEVVDIDVPLPETKHNFADEVDVKRIYAEKKKPTVGKETKTIVADGTKEAECIFHEDGEKQRSIEKEDDDERLKQKNLAINELALTLETRMMKVEKTLVKIREWKTIERNQAKDGVGA